MATPSVLTFDAEGRAVDFEVWLDDLQLFLQCDRANGLSLFDLTSGLSLAPPATADSTVSSQWATRDAAARLAVRRHLPTTERAHFSQYRSAQTLYDAVLARYSSPATAALSRLFLPNLFPDLAAFPTVADLITHTPESVPFYPVSGGASGASSNSSWRRSSSSPPAPLPIPLPSPSRSAPPHPLQFLSAMSGGASGASSNAVLLMCSPSPPPSLTTPSSSSHPSQFLSAVSGGASGAPSNAGLFMCSSPSPPPPLTTPPLPLPPTMLSSSQQCQEAPVGRRATQSSFWRRSWAPTSSPPSSL
ncbi:unnamed protein product [Closterium sp. NIES-53]